MTIVANRGSLFHLIKDESQTEPRLLLYSQLLRVRAYRAKDSIHVTHK